MRLTVALVLLTLIAPAAASQLPSAAAAASTLRGTVVTANDAPIPRVRVAVAGAPATEPAVFTDERGEFAVRVTGSAARLTFTKARYATVTLAVPSDASTFRVRLMLAGAISGRVRDQYGDPVRAAPVIARTRQTPGAPGALTLTTTTNDLGEFRFGGLTAGAYVLYARPMRARESEQQMVSVDPGNESAGIEINVETQAPPLLGAPPGARTGVADASTVRGRVVTPGGAAVVRAFVQIYRSGVPVESVETDARGRYAFDKLAPGEYTLQAFKDGFITPRRGRGQSAVEVLLAGDGSQGTIVSLRPGQAADAVDMILARGGVIAGTIVDEFGDPMEGVAVDALELRVINGRMRALRAVPATPVSRVTDDRGRYRLSGLQPGTYVVQAIARGVLSGGTGYVPTYFPGTTSIDLATAARLPVEGIASGIDLTLSPARAYRVHGTVLDPEGGPANAALTLAVSDRSGAIQVEPVTMRTNADGTFAFDNVAPGDYVLQATTVGTVRDSPSVAVASQFTAAFVTVTTADVPALQLQLSTGATLLGRVTYEGIADPPPTAISLVAVPADFDRAPLIGGGSSTGFSLLADHTFEYRGVFGPSFLRGELRDPQWFVKSITMRGQELADAAVDFGSTGTFRDIEVVISAAGAGISGRVTDDRAAPVRDFAVAVFSTDRDRWTIRSRWIKRARPIQDGAFRVTGLPPGDYWIIAVDRLDGSDVAGDLQDPAVLESLASRATRVTLGEGQSQAMTLRLVRR